MYIKAIILTSNVGISYQKGTVILMIKRLLLGTIMVMAAVVSVGCSVGKGGMLSKVEDAQQSLLKLDSAKLTVSAGITSSGQNGSRRANVTTTELSYLKNSSGVFEYCQSQLDSAKKLIYCEVSDGEKSEQWLLGKGWSVIEPKSYTPDNPHRFITLISNEIDKKSVSNIAKTDTDQGSLYTLTMDSARLNETTYSNTGFEVVDQSVSYLVDPDGLLISYTDIATVVDSDGISSAYTLEVQLSEHNALKEIARPDVMTNTVVDTGAEMSQGEETIETK